MGDAAAPDPNLYARLAWLIAADAEAERRARLRISPREEEEALMIRNALTTERAFARFGLLLGTLPPAATFVRFLLNTPYEAPLYLVFMLPMLAICASFGCYMAKRLGRKFDEAERGSWIKTMLVALGYGFVWAAATGTLGGTPVFIVGGIFGFAFALPVALVAFALFAPLHRLLARGGMIDARQLAPLAWGISATIAALILSPNVMPY
ncbi:MAG: hypothetical protein LC746_00375 [Acidobacteria bacterium]|nr:hypothetical protein [Acidobacteriota bacterium]